MTTQPGALDNSLPHEELARGFLDSVPILLPASLLSPRDKHSHKHIIFDEFHLTSSAKASQNQMAEWMKLGRKRNGDSTIALLSIQDFFP